MKKFFKRFIPNSHDIEHRYTPKVLKKYLQDGSLWHWEKESVARGLAVGLFAAFMPMLQILIGIILSILVRGNVLLAAIATLVTNPLTFVPVTYFIYSVGDLVSGPSQKVDIKNFNWEVHNLSEFSMSFGNWALQFTKSYLIGLVIVAISAAVISYLLVIVLWPLGQKLKAFFKKGNKT